MLYKYIKTLFFMVIDIKNIYKCPKYEKMHLMYIIYEIYSYI